MKKPSNMVSVVVERIKKDKGLGGSSSSDAPDMTSPEESGEDESMMGLESCAEDLISAVRKGDAKAVVAAMRHFMEVDANSESGEPENEE